MSRGNALHRAEKLYSSKRNISSTYLTEVAVDLAVRHDPPITFKELTTLEEHVPRLNQIVNQVEYVIASLWCAG